MTSNRTFVFICWDKVGLMGRAFIGDGIAHRREPRTSTLKPETTAVAAVCWGEEPV